MPADVIIDPSTGQIYWNDGTGSPQSISIKGDAQNAISIVGYSASYSPGSSVGGTLTIATFNDSSGTAAFVPGTTAYELGSATYRWKPFLTTTNISDNGSSLGTNTTSLTTGVFQANGGIAVSGSASIGFTLLLFNSSFGNTVYAGIRASAALGLTTTYTLPSTYPGSGVSFLTATTAGDMFWAAPPSTGTATTSANIQVAAASSGYLYALFSNQATSTSGIGASSDANCFIDATNNVFFINGLALTGTAVTTTQSSFALANTNATTVTAFQAGTAISIGAATGTLTLNNASIVANQSTSSTSTSSGSLVVRGGMGLAGNAFVGGTFTVTNTTTVNGPYGGALNVVGGIGASDVWAYSRIGTGTSADAVSRTEQFSIGTDLGFRIYETTGGQPRVNLARNAAGTNVPALSFQNASGTFASSGAAIGVPDASTTSTLVIYTSNGSSGNIQRLRIPGGSGFVNINQVILGNDTSGTATTSYIRGVDATGTDIAANEIIIQSGRSTGTGAVGGIRFFVATPSTTSATLNTALEVLCFNPIQNATSTATGTAALRGGIGITGNAIIGGTVTIQNSTSSTGTGAGSLVNGGGFGNAGNAFIGGTTSITNNTSSTGTGAGALVVTGGFGLAGNAFIGGTANVTNNTSSTGTGAGALVVTGGFGLAGNAFIGGTFNITNNTSSTGTGAGALVVTGGFGLAGNAFIGGTANVTNNTSSTGTATGALVVTGGLGMGGNAFIGGTVNIKNSTNSTSINSGALEVDGGFGLAGNAFIGGTVTILSTTSSTGTSAGALVNTGGFGNLGNAFIGGTTTILSNTSSTGTGAGALVVTGGFGLAGNAFIGGTTTITSSAVGVGITAGSFVVLQGTASFGNSISVARSVNFFSAGVGLTTYVGLQAGSSTSSITYTLPIGPPGGTGTSVLSSTSAGVMSWVGMGGGSGSPSGNNTELQFNNSASFGGATGLTYQPTLYLTSIASTADHRAVTTVGLRLINHSTVAIAGVQVRWSPALELVGKAILSPSTEYFNRFVTDVYGATSSYEGKQQWKYSYDTGTPSYTNPILELSAQNGVGIGATDATFQNYFKTLSTQAADKTYSLPTDYPSGTGTSYLSASTTGVMAWVAAPTAAGGTPAGSSAQVQYNAGGSFGGATGFEYKAGGVGATVSIYSSAGGGVTSGFWVHAISATSVKVGIGLSNPAYELEINGEISATNKSFVIDHPTKPNMKLRYGSLEGPENGVYIRGRLTDQNVILTPDYWRGLVDPDSFTVNLTPINSYSRLYVTEIKDYKVYIKEVDDKKIDCFFTVWAERKDISKLIVEY